MLALLHIHDFALVDDLTIEFAPGFNVFTGETGAGKSILIDAISAALGERCGPEAVRSGAVRATVEAVFDVNESFPPALLEWAEEGQIILARELTAAGRSSFRINGRLSTAAAMRSVSADLLDIHGQHEHQSLLLPRRHSDLFDSWAGPPVRDARLKLLSLTSEIRDVRARLVELTEGERERVHRIDLYRYQINEIDEAAPREEDEAELQQEAVRLANAEKLASLAGAAHAGLAGEGGHGAVDLLAAAELSLREIASIDASTTSLCALLESASAAASEAAREIRNYAEGIEHDPRRLDEVQDRLELYRSLRKKYGDSVREVLAYRSRIQNELEQLTQGETGREALQARLRPLRAAAELASAELHEARQAAAARFRDEIVRHLRDLSMKEIRFDVALEPPDLEAAASTGRVEFLLSANPGEPLRPLARIASGGEISRVMLALKTSLAGSHPLALIFDEIDTGVGGRTGESLGRKMRQLSASNQVLCITHLAGIACLADRHLQVSRVVEGERTIITVRVLEGESRVGELARMLGGAEETAAVHARRLLSAARG